MAVVNGLGGSVTFASGYTSNVTDWSISFAGAELDTTAMGTTGNWETYIPGRRSWTGTYTAWWAAEGTDILTPNANPATGGSYFCRVNSLLQPKPHFASGWCKLFLWRSHPVRHCKSRR